jgi:hypothetical protein
VFGNGESRRGNNDGSDGGQVDAPLSVAARTARIDNEWKPMGDRDHDLAHRFGSGGDRHRALATHP